MNIHRFPPPANDIGHGTGGRLPARGVASSQQKSPDAPDQSRKLMGMTRYPEAFVPTLSVEARDAFKAFNPAAFWIGGNLDGAQPKSFSDQRGSWPIRFGVTQVWKFNAAEKKLCDAFFERGLLLRYWCRFDAGALKSWSAAERLQVAAIKALEPHFAPALNNFEALDPDVTLDGLNAVVTDAARGLGIEVLTCRELADHLESLVRIAHGVGGKG